MWSLNSKILYRNDAGSRFAPALATAVRTQIRMSRNRAMMARACWPPARPPLTAFSRLAITYARTITITRPNRPPPTCLRTSRVRKWKSRKSTSCSPTQAIKSTSLRQFTSWLPATPVPSLAPPPTTTVTAIRRSPSSPAPPSCRRLPPSVSSARRPNSSSCSPPRSGSTYTSFARAGRAACFLASRVFCFRCFSQLVSSHHPLPQTTLVHLPPWFANYLRR